jgi:glycosyltransferase domain-containing protein
MPGLQENVMHSHQVSGKLMPLNEQLTLVLLTQDQPALLRRAMHYYSNLPCRVLVLDSSGEPSTELAEAFPQMDYQHVSQFAAQGRQQKIAFGVAQVKTPFAVMADDSDFLMHDAMRQSVQFLSDNSDYGLCHGYALMFVGHSNKVEYLRRDKKVIEDYSSNEAQQRVSDFFGQYLPPLHAVTRTELLKEWYEVLPAGTADELQEYGHAFYLLARAKARILAIPYALYELDERGDGNQSNLLRKLTESTSVAVLQRQHFAEFLGSQNTGVHGLDATQLTQLALSGYDILKDCLGERRSLTVTRILESQWPDVFRPLERLFGQRQFVEMPFYNQAFFDVLTEIEFLIHAIPAGRQQLEELEGLWARQEMLLRTHENDTPDTIANRLWQAMELSIFNPSVVAQLAELINEQGDQDESAQLGAWLERLSGLKTEDIHVRFANTASGRLVQWLDDRQPTVEELGKLREHLAEAGGGPQFCILLLDLDDEADKLQITLDSLVEGHYKNFKVVVFTTGQPPAATTAQNTLHFVKVSKSNYIDKVNLATQQTRSDWFLMAEVGDQLTVGGLLRASVELQAAPDCRAVFADEIHRQIDGKLTHVMRPGFNLDLLQSLPALMSRHWLMRRDVLLNAGGYSADFAQALEFELLLRVIDQGGLAWLAHLDEPLLVCEASPMEENPQERLALTRLLNNRGYKGQISSAIPGTWKIDYRHVERPLVSIIMECDDNLASLHRCLSNVTLRTRYAHYEVIIADNHSQSPEVTQWLAAQTKGRVRVIRSQTRLSKAALRNSVVAQAKGEYVILLSSEGEVVNPNWIESLLNQAQRPEVGVVGAKLIDRSGKVSQAGLILGMNGGVGSAFVGEAKDAPGYLHRLVLEHNYSAVSDVCLMIRKSVFDAVGGLDEEMFSDAYGDVDLCLKSAQHGYLTVWTPYVHILHPGTMPDQPAVLAALREKWAGSFAHDLAYNRNLAFTGKGFTLDRTSSMDWAQLIA